MQLDESELATVLAGLRMFQKTYEDRDAKYIRQHESHFDDAAPLGTDDIETLCERLNTEAPEAFTVIFHDDNTGEAFFSVVKKADDHYDAACKASKFIVKTRQNHTAA